MFILAGGCSDVAGDTSTISISLGIENGKAAVSIDELRHVITLSGPTGRQTHSLAGRGTIRATVAPGLWRLDAEGVFSKTGGTIDGCDGATLNPPLNRAMDGSNTILPGGLAYTGHAVMVQAAWGSPFGMNGTAGPTRDLDAADDTASLTVNWDFN